MVNERLQRKLERNLDLPAMPFVLSQLLKALDNPDIRASKLAELIEKDQSLTTRVLKVANSSFYGFSKKIATVELAIIIMGLNSIKEIVIGLIVKKLFAGSSSNLDTKAFWQYSLFCGSAARLIARKIGYPLAGEAFVAGLVHDLGILVINKFMPAEASQIWQVSRSKGISYTEAERYVLADTHAEVGAWISEKWRLPDKITSAIYHHHTSYTKLDSDKGIDQLTSIVSLAEWFAYEMEQANWSNNLKRPELYLDGEFISTVSSDGAMTERAVLESLKQQISKEFERAKTFSDINNSTSLYKRNSA